MIDATTGTGILSSSAEIDAHELTGEMIASYELENRSPLVLENRFSGDGDYSFIGNDVTDYSTFSKKAQRKGKGLLGTVKFSRVGYNQGMTRALVFASYSCGGLCGSGDFYFLTKTDKGWAIAWVQNSYKI